MGDTITDSWYWCPVCAVYTIWLAREVFAGPEMGNSSDPISREEGERRLAEIRRCEEPWNDRCRCPGHRAYFGDWLD